jgi:hypothetical protein
LDRFKNKYYDPNLKVEKERVVLFPSYTTEVELKRVNNNPIPSCLVSIDTLTRVVDTQTVWDLLGAFNRSGRWEEDERSLAVDKLVGSIVCLRYSSKFHTITAIQFDKTPTNTPIPSGKDTTSHYEYYVERKINIVHKDEPPLLVAKGRSQAKIYLIPELCSPTELSDEAKQILPEICSILPEDRSKRIQGLKELLTRKDIVNGRSPPLLEYLGFKLLDRVQVKGESLSVPEIQLVGLRMTERDTNNWGPLSKNICFDFNPTNQNRLTVILAYDDDRKSNELAEKWFTSIGGMLQDCKARFQFTNAPIVIPMRRGDKEHPIMREIARGKLVNPFVFAFLSKGFRLDYLQIKKLCLANGILSQCINVSKHFREKPGVKENVMKQILCKHGEFVWWLDIPRTFGPQLGSETIVMIGIDVFHSKKVWTKKKETFRQRRSVAAMVAFVYSGETKKFTTYAETCIHLPKQEILDTADSGSESSASSGSLVEDSSVRVSAWAKEGALSEFLLRTAKHLNLMGNKKFRVTVWRDGVADSQLDTVQNTEVLLLQKAMQKLSLPTNHLSFIVCQKRIHTKFFINRGPIIANPAKGTVVSNLGSIRYEDFFLYSTEVSKSTSKPVRYIILQKDPIIPIIPMTYAMTFMYQNWPAPIKLPAPTQCAHVLAEKVGKLPDERPNVPYEQFINRPFYL